MRWLKSIKRYALKINRRILEFSNSEITISKRTRLLDLEVRSEEKEIHQGLEKEKI